MFTVFLQVSYLYILYVEVFLIPVEFHTTLDTSLESPSSAASYARHANLK